MFTDQVIEIDLYTNLRKQRFVTSDESYATMEELWLHIPHPIGRSISLPLRSTRQRYGLRLSFLCQYCNHRVQKLYVHPRHYNGTNYPIACRKCHHLKYVSQYRKDNFNRRNTAQYKLKRIEGQKRRYWYGDKHTQFGRRWQKLKDDSKTFWDIMAEIEREAPELLTLVSVRRSE